MARLAPGPFKGGKRGGGAALGEDAEFIVADKESTRGQGRASRGIMTSGESLRPKFWVQNIGRGTAEVHGNCGVRAKGIVEESGGHRVWSSSPWGRAVTHLRPYCKPELPHGVWMKEHTCTRTQMQTGTARYLPPCAGWGSR